MTTYTLQEWFVHINRMYSDRNLYRSVESMCCHLIEVCQGLNTAANKRRNRDFNPEDFLPKCVGWWLALCGKVGVRNIEDMLWAKFPKRCPYCQRTTHFDDGECKNPEKKTDKVLWLELKSLGAGIDRPQTLGLWQDMFQEIYPRERNERFSQNDSVRLSEELGELCEAIRSLAIAPQYFISEAPDVFAWLMGIANQFDADYDREFGFKLERNMVTQYPSTCRFCDFAICKCPPIHPDTLGRIADDASVTFEISPHQFGLTQLRGWFEESLAELELVKQRRRSREKL
jgi:NTP pyrophosphatase (non-canonical NTP hydrolase)